MATDIPRVRKRGAADHGRQQARYAYEQKVAAVRAVVEDGMTRPAATAEFGIMPMVPFD